MADAASQSGPNDADDAGQIFIVQTDGGAPTSLAGSAGYRPRSLEVFDKTGTDVIYFTGSDNEWGESLNFDGPDAAPVREYFIENAAYWIDEFHLDGLRLDATQQIFDASPEHVLVTIGQRVRKAAG